MSLLQAIKNLNWKSLNEVWTLIEPFVINLIKKEVPKSITKLYENLAKYTQPAIQSLFKLKEKVKKTPSELDNYCLSQGINALDAFAHYLLSITDQLKTE